MNYPDGTEIPANLPNTYRPTSINFPPSGDPRTLGQRCKNCKHYDNGYCTWWKAPVRDDYYCKSWAQIERKKTK